jgi:AraC-like DNA-binding protein
MQLMDIISLPTDLGLSDQGAFGLFDYRTEKDCVKNKIELTKNTLSFLIDGAKEVITGTDSTAIENAEFLMMKSGHCLMTESLPSSNQAYRSMLLFFSNEAIFEFVNQHNITYKSTSPVKSVEVFKYDNYLRSFVQSLADICQLDARFQSKLLQVKFEELMLYLVETRGTEFIHFLTVNSDSHLSDFVKAVENNKLNKLTLSELAFLSNMSVSSFKREFEKHYEESPIKWFQERRLEQAAFLLKQRQKRPSDIYEDAGYESLSTFIQAFKHMYGLTPKQYQQD